MQEEQYKSYLSTSLSNSQDIIFTEREINQIVNNIYSLLISSPKTLRVKLASILVHLDIGWFTGRHSWSFRQRIKDEGTLDISQLHDNSYTFPEWFKNETLTEDEFVAIRDRRREEFKTVYNALIKKVNPEGSLLKHVCFDEDCGLDVPCELREIIVPVIHNDGDDVPQASGLCIPYTEALDIFNSDNPIYPDELEQPIPDFLLEVIRSKYSAELKMRSWYLANS